MVELDELNATDLAAMLAMMAMLTVGHNDSVQLARYAYEYADALMDEKRLRDHAMED